MFETDKPEKKLEVLQMIKRHPIISIVAVVLIAAGIFFAFRSQNANASPKAEKTKEKPKEDKKLPVEVAQAKNGTITSSLVTTATLDPDRQVTMTPETTGVVNRITVAEGDVVREGQLLATLSDRERQVKLQQSNVKVQNAKRELDRKHASFNAKIISESEYQKAKYDLEIAIQERNAAQVELDRSIIKAPFTGIITQRFIEKGQNITP